ncbi:dihydrodipicolinate synthase family protein [Bradyrhizobium sp. 180]|uniref:dihydrodipicolinate synthase family protein n=1 Tax=unclassified Bradyrhizobium TaxID=2631580 RepID=UPI001FF96EDF|nr:MULTISPECIES: dihydrodipicolinate synthase family protein [unclassified Bradyrhizobium]MCK1425165.1 dihydrodipicolinate synthase family protein [Bradyrhizobium sp. CW12]MCK1490395.1 dihydrodipicolinate synthase family protein [Bradyrhizobium sp. 180]MCK1532530.1 dihydrodipicolinate synthase family protein [Bradyrhizobium sp. 182]MCK1599358.1 dihydrodipicolinate synthase family protein [Bradyrhizobium sp. 164]MCK1616812.1 dihydrodipicolinate synthase family protein [Bradyrhizobium sp. 159]
MMEAIRGFWVASVTPLATDGSVDSTKLAAHAKQLFSRGIDGVVLFGTTGEGTSFTAAERIATIEAVLKAGVAPERIGIGGGFPAITDGIALTRAVLGLGLRHVLLLPPYFDRNVTPEGIEDAFAAIIDGVGDDRLRASLYHIPQVSGVAIPTSVAANLRKRYGKVVAGLKDSSGDFKEFQAFRNAAPDLAITVGNEADIARAIAAGGAGTICGMANVVPELVKAMVDGKDVEARMQAAIDVVDKTPSLVATLKAILAAQTGDASWLRVRPPLRALSDGAAFQRKLDALMAPAIA